MAMNRETKRMLQRQGQEVTADGQIAPTRAERRGPTATAPHRERTRPTQFVKEVRAELRKVAWATREELVRYSTIVLITLIVVTALIFGLDWLFAQAVLRLFD